MQNVTKYVGDIYRFDPRHRSDEKISRIKMLFKTIYKPYIISFYVKYILVLGSLTLHVSIVIQQPKSLLYLMSFVSVNGSC